MLTERDRHLVAVLAHARWLTTPQLRRLMFPGRHKRMWDRATKRLASDRLGPALLQKHVWLTREGMKPVWGLTAAGYREAELLLDEELTPPPVDFEPETMAHHVLLTELYVGLLAAPFEPALKRVPAALPAAERRRALAGLYARALHRAWRWTVVGDGVQLPWKVSEDGRQKDRVLRPDAVLTLTDSKRRLFLEAETGSHTVVPRHADNKPNSTLAKLDRYEAYVSGLADGTPRRTWYQAKYGDGFTPELVFLVHSERRAATVAHAIGQWRAQHLGAGLNARAATAATLLAELGGVAGPRERASVRSAPVPAGMFALSREEAAALVDLVMAVRKDFKKRQEAAVEAGEGVPAALPGYEGLKPVIARLLPASSSTSQDR